MEEIMNNNIIENYGYNDFFRAQAEAIKAGEENLTSARVIEVHREQYKIVSEHGENSAKLKGSIFYNENINNEYPAIGDFVLVKPNPYGEAVIYSVLERKSKFSRLDSFNEVEQVVASNFDYVFIMTSLNHDFNLKRVERYLAAAWQSGAEPVIVLTKTDLCSNYWHYAAQIEKLALRVPVIPVSAFTGEGLDELKEYIKPSVTIVFLGSSGVGKSSLVNAVAGEGIMKVSSIREDDSKGRHTTTHRQLIMLKNGTMIIDTPGMRELGMWNVSEGLDNTFSEIDALSSECRFRDCSHESEPGCAVRMALESGELPAERWQNYLKLKKESKFAERKESLNARMKEKAREKSIAKFQKEVKYKRV
jgi:ribosome biogenesis GTPase / thiamine phosphate phosphatase